MQHFYPRSPCGERPAQKPTVPPMLYFYPRSPCGERPGAAELRKTRNPFLSTLSLRRATHFTGWISCISPNFYPRSPCGERHCDWVNVRGTDDFYPRSPCGERHLPLLRPLPRDYFYPRSPCGERRVIRYGVAGVCDHISIHALLAESDLMRIFSELSTDISIHALLAESDRSR